jgi:FixJ family two-component response regulator
MSRGQPIYVAVVDDDENVGRALGRLFRASGIHPVTYTSAEDFLGDLKRPQFDCLVFDVQLGGMSGIELGRRLAVESYPAPFICITAHDDPETRAKALAAGCAAYFRKTDPGVEVLEAIRRLTA